MVRKGGLSLVVAVSLVFALAAPAVWAAGTTSSPQFGGDRANLNQLQSDLYWLFAGLQKLDKEAGLRLSKKQAADILAVLKPLVDQKLLMPDPPAPRAASGRGAQGEGISSGNFRNLTPEQREQLRKRREARANQLRTAMAAIDKILTPKQVEFIDNLDFDPSPYVFTPQFRANQGAGAGQGVGQGAAPSPVELEQLRAKARETLVRAAKLTRQTYELLQKRAAGK